MICNNCGCTFDENDVVKVREDYGEIHSACPYCGMDDMEETALCEVCEKEHRADDLACGICAKCLYDAIDYDVARAYLKETGRLTDFMLKMVYQCGDLGCSSPEFDELMENSFNYRASVERCVYFSSSAHSQDLLGLAKDWILPNYPLLMSEEFEFADWYHDYREAME